MAKRRSQKRRTSHHIQHEWLPVDTRIFPDIISFRCVKGPLRVFLQIEMVLSLLIVIGTCGIVIIHFWPF